MTISSPKKNYNVLALRGAAVDDMEYVEQFNLDPSVAYTPKLNEIMLDMTEQQNYEHYLKDMDEVEAKTMARSDRKSSERDIKKLLARRGMLK